MGKRQLSESNRDWLQGELRHWADEGLVDDERAGRILDLYETPEDSTARRSSLAAFILTGVAALLVGAALLLFIGYNWQAMPAALKVAVILGITFGTHALAFWLRFGRGARLGSEIAFFLGSLFFGCGIWLIAQIFHIQSHYPLGFWWWAVGTLPIALCLDTILLHTLVVALLGIWVGTEILGDLRALLPWSRVIPDACFTLPLLAAPGIAWAYRKKSPTVLGLYLPLIAWWLALQPIAWQFGLNPVYFIGATGALMLIAAEAHPDRSQMAIPFRVYGVLIAVGTLIPLTFSQFNLWTLSETSGANRWWSALAGFLIGLLAPAAAFLAERWKATSDDVADVAKRVGTRQWLPVGFAVMLGGLCLWNGMFGSPTEGNGWDWDDRANAAVVLPTIVTNLVMLALAAWLLRIGLREDRLQPFAAGVAVFLGWTLMRYVDLFGEAGGMLGASLMFLLCGLSLFGVARFWIDRKQDSHVPAD